MAVGNALAQSALFDINPDTLSTTPPLPAPGQAVTFTIVDITGNGSAVEDFTVNRVGTSIEIRARIRVAYGGSLGAYTIAAPLGPLEAGTYVVTYIAEARRPDQEYTGETKQFVWRFVVLDPTLVATAVEYFNAPNGHYFTTAEPIEISLLDSGHFSGWQRTGERLVVLKTGSTASHFAGVCRFYGRPEASLDTHFYSAMQQECDDLIGQGGSAWILETVDAYRVFPVDLATGACPINLIGAHRAWNGKPDVNHRYTTSAAVLATMVSSGWIAEGAGPDIVVWCVLPAGTAAQ